MLWNYRLQETEFYNAFLGVTRVVDGWGKRDNRPNHGRRGVECTRGQWRKERSSQKRGVFASSVKKKE